MDIGGNTGFFSFESVDKGAREVCYYEGNKDHAEFVGLGVKVADLENRIIVKNKYFSFDGKLKEKYDIVFLLNVLHHLGDDYGSPAITMKKAKEHIIDQLNSLKKIAKVVVFQMGFNWKGDVAKPLFEKGEKVEMIEFIKKGVQNNWDILHIGIAEKKDGVIVYNDLNSYNIKREDEWGEFLNRPLFILKSKK